MSLSFMPDPTGSTGSHGLSHKAKSSSSWNLLWSPSLLWAVLVLHVTWPGESDQDSQLMEYVASRLISQVLCFLLPDGK